MRFASWLLLLSLGTLLTCSATRFPEVQFQPAPESLFESRPFQSDCAVPPAGSAIGFIITGRHLPFQRKHGQKLTFSLSEFPSLTLTADESNMIHVAGSHRDNWSLDFCARGEGNTESEALAQLQQVSIDRVGNTVSLNNAGAIQTRTLNSLIVDAPAAAPLVVHASFAAVEVRDMTGPVRVTATHARATILDTTGKVDSSAFVVDFAGSAGTVKLSSETEINVKFRAPHFRGSLMAWAQGPVRILVPVAFQTPFQAIVNRPQDFACRADICSKVTLTKQGSLCIFTYPGDGSAPPSALHFRSELQTLVIDNGR